MKNYVAILSNGTSKEFIRVTDNDIKSFLLSSEGKYVKHLYEAKEINFAVITDIKFGGENE